MYELFDEELAGGAGTGGCVAGGSTAAALPLATCAAKHSSRATTSLPRRPIGPRLPAQEESQESWPAATVLLTYDTIARHRGLW
jgi:hypothetical protein